MEQILIVIFQIFFSVLELVFTLGFYSPIEVAHRRHEREWPLWRVVLWASFGGIATGALSLLLIDHVLVQSPSLRVVNLVIIPLMGGWMNYKIAKGPNVLEPERHFWGAFMFALLCPSSS